MIYYFIRIFYVSVFSGLRTSEVLMIDSQTEHLGGTLQNLWEREGGTDQYPPPSLRVRVIMAE